jgi:chromosome segregation ATPase
MANTGFSTIDINKAAADLNNALKEGAYIAVGLGVLGFQRAQLRRVELAKQLESQWQQLSKLPAALSAQLESYSRTTGAQREAARGQVAGQLSELAKNLDEAFAPARERVARLTQAELPQIPDFGEQLKETTQAIEEQFETVRAQLIELAKALDEWLQPVRQQLDEQMDRLEEALPAGARSVVQSVRAATTGPEQVFRSTVGLN